MLTAAGHLAREKIQSTKEISITIAALITEKQLRPAACSGRGKRQDVSDSPTPFLLLRAHSTCVTPRLLPFSHNPKLQGGHRLPLCLQKVLFWQADRTHIGVFLCWQQRGRERDGRLAGLLLHRRGCLDHICIHFHELPIKVTNRTQSAN